jgi:hypothetical protein
MYYTIVIEKYSNNTKVFSGATKEEAAIPEAFYLLELTEEILEELKEREEDFLWYTTHLERGKFALSQGDFLKAAGELWNIVEGYFASYDIHSFDDSDLIVMSREEAAARLLAKDIV